VVFTFNLNLMHNPSELGHAIGFSVEGTDAGFFGAGEWLGHWWC
jgi:hypothetical protein